VITVEEDLNIWDVSEVNEAQLRHTFSSNKDFLASPAQLIQKLTDTSLDSNFCIYMNTLYYGMYV
jgi:hypothetical protein